jgi:SecD/SecF fusion protein
MQNKGAIKFFAIALAIVCLFQLSFTFFSKRVESKARNYARNEVAAQLAKELAKGNSDLESNHFDSIVKARESYYLDSMATSLYIIYWSENIPIRK